MRKYLLSILLLMLLVSPGANAKVKFSGGVEWGYKVSLYHKFHYNYLSQEGVRINDQGKNFEAFSNGEIYGFAGAYLNDYINLSLYAGYSGIYNDRRVYPVSARATYYVKGRSNDGIKMFIDSGCAFAETFSKHGIVLGKAGLGYRFALDKNTGLDLNLTAEYAADHPTKVIDKYAGTIVTESDLRRCDFKHVLIGMSISLSF